MTSIQEAERNLFLVQAYLRQPYCKRGHEFTPENSAVYERVGERDRLTRCCKICKRESSRARHRNNPEYQLAWCNSNRERLRKYRSAYMRARYKKNPEEARTRARKWKHNHPEYVEYTRMAQRDSCPMCYSAKQKASIVCNACKGIIYGLNGNARVTARELKEFVESINKEQDKTLTRSYECLKKSKRQLGSLRQLRKQSTVPLKSLDSLFVSTTSRLLQFLKQKPLAQSIA